MQHTSSHAARRRVGAFTFAAALTLSLSLVGCIEAEPEADGDVSSESSELLGYPKLILTNEYVTPVSGYAGLYDDVVPGNSDYQGLMKLFWMEEADHPSEIQVTASHINTRTERTAQLDIQPNLSPGNGKTVELTGLDDRIYKVQVCTTNKNNTANNRLKGIRIWARTINYGDPVTLTSQTSGHEARHTNCNLWHTPQACEVGYIAVGLRVHNDGQSFRGIALYCRRVELKPRWVAAPTPVPPTPGVP